ncbi:MAG: HRDC domain-containing protein [Planctomycetales bacterium]|nr:HRDC domain-containing protein [Planctomycetales bacterium]
MTIDFILVESPSQMPGVEATIAGSDLVGMDTEFVAEDCYRPDLCLLQISTREKVFIIDPKAVVDIDGLWDLLVQPEKTVVVHAGREEILFAYRATGSSIPKLFDVQLASGFLGNEYPASYGKLIQRILRQVVPKGETRTDWRKRPLTKSQLEYAALDVLHLPELHDRLTSELSSMGRLDWFHAEVIRRQQILLESQNREAWSRISGVQTLSDRQLGIVRQLWLWRESRAELKNLPPRRVLRDDLIIELARRGTADPKKIAHVRGLHFPGQQRFIPELAQVIHLGLENPIVDAPWTSTSKGPRPPSLLQQYLTAGMSFLCRTHNIAPGIVGTSDDVGRLAAYWIDESPTEYELPLLLVGWRAELVGEPLHDIFSGRKALRVKDPTDEMPLDLCDIPND